MWTTQASNSRVVTWAASTKHTHQTSTHMASGASYCTDALGPKSCLKTADSCHTRPTTANKTVPTPKWATKNSSLLTRNTGFQLKRPPRETLPLRNPNTDEPYHHTIPSTLDFSCFFLGMIIFHLQPRLGTNKIGIRSWESSVQASFPLPSRN